MTFIDENCVIFDNEEENKLVYYDKFNEFRTLIDNLLNSHLTDVGVTEEQFAAACESGMEHPAHRDVFEKLIAVDDFLTFKKLMIKRNVELELEVGAVKLVDRHDRLDTLGESLAEHGLGLHRYALDTVDDDKGTVSNAKSRSHLGGEVNVTRGVDEVDEELAALRVLGHALVRDLLRVDLVVEGDASGLDGDATLGLVRTSVGEALVTG